MTSNLCAECRAGHHGACLGGTYDAKTRETTSCGCSRCHPPPPQRCDACGGLINPQTAECLCSD